MSFAPVITIAWNTSDLFVLQIWWPFKKFVAKALLAIIKDTVT